MLINTIIRFLVGDFFRLGFGAGGSSHSPAPTSQTISQTNIPPELMPYATETLGKAKALTDINQNPYQQYQGNRIAGFNPLQNQALNSVQNMQASPAIGAGMGMAGAAGIGSLNAGGNYNRMATDPSAMQAFMSPYAQLAIDPTLRENQRQFDIANIGRQAAAARSGAFGGSRQAIEQSEAQRNLGTLQSNTQAQGMQNAFQQAQQAQQYGANLGLQGYGQANQAAQNLGALGMQNYQQNMGIAQAQALGGAQVQAQEQQALSQQYQDFLNQQNYPYKQLGFMSDLIRGTPTSGGAATMYQAPPNTMGQIAGLGIAGLNAMSGKPQKEGGAIKGYNQGGEVTNFAVGGLAGLTNPNFSDPSTELQVKTAAKQAANGQPQPIPLDVLTFLQSQLENLHTAPPTPGTTTVAEDVAKKVLENSQQQKMQAESPMPQQQAQQAPQLDQQAPQQDVSEPIDDGIGSLPTNITPESYNGGGIVAFGPGGLTLADRLGVTVENEAQPDLSRQSIPQDKPAYGSLAGMERAIEEARLLAKPRELSEITSARQKSEAEALAAAGITGNLGDDRRKQIEKYQASDKDNKAEALRNYFVNAGLGMAAEASKRGNPVSGIGALLQPLSVGASGAAPGYFSELEKQKARTAGYETELSGLSDARRAEILSGTRADSATREKELVNARNIEQHAIDQQGKLVAARLGREPKALSDMVTFANSYLTAMREAGDPRKDNQILSDGQARYLDLKATAEARNTAAGAAVTTAGTGVIRAGTDIAETNEKARNNYQRLVKDVESAFETQATNRRSELFGQLQDAQEIDDKNKNTNKKNINTSGYKPLPTNTSRVLHDRLLKARIDAIEKPVTLVVPTAAPKPATATTPAEQKAAGNAPVPGAYKVGEVVPGTDKNGKPISMKLTQNNKGELVWEPQ